MAGINVSFGAIDLDEAHLTMTIETTVANWRKLAQELPPQNPSCLILRDKILAMLQNSKVDINASRL